MSTPVKKLTSRIVGNSSLGTRVPSEMHRISKSGEVLNFSANNDGWIAREGSTDDPSGSTDITQTKTARDVDQSGLDSFLATLAQLDDLHIQGQTMIADYLAKASKGKVNVKGPTHSANGQERLSGISYSPKELEIMKLAKSIARKQAKR